MSIPTVAIQMYSLRDLAQRDFLGTLALVADIGYEAVEFAGFYDTPARLLRQRLNQLGLTAPSAHIGLNFTNPDRMESEFEAQLEYASELGLKHVITPWAPLPAQPTIDELARLAELFYRCGEQASRYGLKYGYHNHEAEFKLVAGRPAIDHLLERVPAELMTMEFDLGWVYVAGNDPVDYLRRYAGRVPLAHFKDLSDGRRDMELGSGKVGYERLIPEAIRAGVQYMIVEQEQFAVSAVESAKQNLAFFESFDLSGKTG
ncbi:sugar phosphate isomerase/epimerase family protein [Paenibacillus radicis (ex Gao et al. 2016)]|uniref:Sugar phosphate isomerase n=1 Tax=Paenibacillus radicis (ex Gao et al. 2016) TaxID=1737354 RepID=A0A917H529_9BACL|nr:sugar phosphate isomerase/epimerase [Paenibacillus radicis (ex Gao et al. 2016)]GGG67658.1 sugar phosphate isomerase [Paenibacillus radicis (ex Gao et al. 2016)]